MGPVRQAGFPIGLSRTPAGIDRPAPALGEQTGEVLKAIGYDQERIERQFDAPGSEAHAQAEAVFAARTRAEWEAFAEEHDCCLEPVLGLEEALQSELVRARGMVATLAQPGAADKVRLLGVPVKLSETPGDPARGPGPVLGEHTESVLSALGYADDEIRQLKEAGAVAGAGTEVPGSFMA